MNAAVFSVATLAEHWACGTDTIYSLIRSGDLRAFKLGGKLLRIRADEVERFECQTTACNDTAANSPSCGTKVDDATDIRLERLIERPQRPQLVHSGKSAR
ncbi:helix-turn-helix domain-containing protein [Sphingobium xenophagum]|uniref:helix-turn-helix domain-containing protein n=1 Tax=Sphingobium xenophagum TaxID=121428 RepID=UPI0012FD723C